MGNGLNNVDYKKTALFPWEQSSSNSNSRKPERVSAWMVDDEGNYNLLTHFSIVLMTLKINKNVHPNQRSSLEFS